MKTDWVKLREKFMDMYACPIYDNETTPDDIFEWFKRELESEQLKESAKENLKKYTIETYEQNGENIMAKCNDGFNAMELLGIMEVSKEDIINQIKGFVKPDIIKRTVIK